MSHLFKKNIFFSKKNIYVILFLIFCLVIFLFLKKTLNIYSLNNIKYQLPSIKYEKIIKTIDIKKPLTLIQAEDFIKQNKNINGIFISFFLAKQYVLNNQLKKAITTLDNSLKYAQEENLKNLLLLKIATIKIEQHDYQHAINILNKIKDHSWDNIIKNYKGDIFKQLHNNKKAKQEWENSQEIEESNIIKKIIQIKINNA
ncbi:tetratricopeptide repeat protein [Buchnera aphidicola]|uniref:tetratricopeptide repeat protein n=1 Tax=Buchnera aphidicola TaxID=9 RepID=UPI003BEF0C06